MKQRALIALSVVLEPDVLVMDEPTAALDLLMQRSILSLLEVKEVRPDARVHHARPAAGGRTRRPDGRHVRLPTGRDRPDREILEHAAHPYTRALLNATPNLDAPLSEMRPIDGSAPDPVDVPAGCSYHPRCPLADDTCVATDPTTTASPRATALPATTGHAAEIPFNVDAAEATTGGNQR